MLVFHAMDWLGIQITRADVDRWLAQARDYALPKLLQTGGQVLLGVVVFLAARWALIRIQRRFAARTESKLDDHIVEVIRRCAQISVTAWVAWRVAHIWELAGLAALVIAVWIVALAIPLADFVAKLLRVVEAEVVPKTETTLDDTALPLVNKVVRFLIIGAGVVLALTELDIDITPIIAGASVAGLAVGLAAQDTLSNLVAGVLLILDRPFQVGDRIEVWSAPTNSATWGDVVEVGLRATRIRTTDNIVIVVPNNQIMQRDIINYTATGDDIRLRIAISIAFDADSEKAKEIVRRVAMETDGVIHDPAPQVIIRRFGESSVDLQLRVWIEDARRRRAIGDEITDRVKTEFDRAGVEIPYAKRDLYIRTMPAELPAAAAALPETTRQPAATQRGTGPTDTDPAKQGGQDE